MRFAYTARLHMDLKKFNSFLFFQKERMYERLFDYLHGRGIETTVFYERDKQNKDKWHVHGTLNIPINVFRKQMIKDVNEIGYYFFIKPVYEEGGWDLYIRKQQNFK